MKTANFLPDVYKAIRLQYKGAVPLIRDGDDYITFSVDAVLIHEKPVSHLLNETKLNAGSLCFNSIG